jgi:hypothetical protein
MEHAGKNTAKTTKYPFPENVGDGRSYKKQTNNIKCELLK